MTIKTKLTQKDYINASVATIWARPFARILLAVFCLIILINIIVSTVNGGTGALLSSLFPPVIILIIWMGMIYFGFKRSYSNNKMAGEQIEYRFDPGSNFFITGESFKSELSWNKVHKVTLTKNWLLIWQNRQIANAIPKKDILENQLGELKNILTNNQVKNNL